jgi:hypothetical protein
VATRENNCTKAKHQTTTHLRMCVFSQRCTALDASNSVTFCTIASVCCTPVASSSVLSLRRPRFCTSSS